LDPGSGTALAGYWPQKVLAVSSVNAAMQNYIRVHEHQTRPNPALAVVHGQAALLLRATKCRPNMFPPYSSPSTR
jgi:hypothetical protein